MELEEVIRQRRSIRKFKSTPIEEAKLEKLLKPQGCVHPPRIVSHGGS